MGVFMWYDIFVSFIGALLGFAFALLGEAIISWFVRKRDIKCYLKNIKQELSEIYEKLVTHKDAEDIILFFDIPIWEAFIQSGDIRYLLNKSFYVELLNVYSKIKNVNDLEVANQDDKLDKQIIKKRNEIYNSLSNVLSDPSFLNCL